MDGRLDIDSFEKAINGLNKNLSDVGLLFRANMPLLATDATQVCTVATEKHHHHHPKRCCPSAVFLFPAGQRLQAVPLCPPHQHQAVIRPRGRLQSKYPGVCRWRKCYAKLI